METLGNTIVVACKGQSVAFKNISPDAFETTANPAMKELIKRIHIAFLERRAQQYRERYDEPAYLKTMRKLRELRPK